MVMSTEAKESARNGKSRGNSPNSIKSSSSAHPQDVLSPDISDDDTSNNSNLEFLSRLPNLFIFFVITFF